MQIAADHDLSFTCFCFAITIFILRVKQMTSLSTISTCSSQDLESIGIVLPDLEETQIWDSPNDSVSMNEETNRLFQ